MTHDRGHLPIDVFRDMAVRTISSDEGNPAKCRRIADAEQECLAKLFALSADDSRWRKQVAF